MDTDTVRFTYPELTGMRYLPMLQKMHELLKPAWYLEVGTFRGRSLNLCSGDFVAVDPRFKLGSTPIPPAASRGHFFQMTSDAFFDTGFLDRNGICIDFAFLDGLHHFDALLRDFMHAERHMAQGGVIALHDCCPLSAEMTSRDMTEGLWTGDVWKTIAILKKHRPDLTIRISTARPTGLAVVTGLNPASRVLDAVYDDEVARMTRVPNDDAQLAAYYDSIRLQSPSEILATL